MGRDSGQNPSQGPGAPGLLPGDYRVFEVLQGVTPAGHRGVSPRIHGTGGGQTAAGDVATDRLEGGFELVFQDGRKPNSES